MITTLFAAVISRLGLSQSEAAESLGVRIDSLKAWCSGRRRPPDTIWPEIVVLARKRAAEMGDLAREIETRIRDAA